MHDRRDYVFFTPILQPRPSNQTRPRSYPPPTLLRICLPIQSDHFPIKPHNFQINFIVTAQCSRKLNSNRGDVQKCVPRETYLKSF